MSRPASYLHGFTLLELVLVLALGLILTSATYLLGMSALRSHQFQRASGVIQRELWQARADTLANTKDSNWGVQFSPQSITRYRGNAYASRFSEDDIVYTFEAPLTVSSTGEVTFLRPGATVNSSRTIVITDQLRTATTIVSPSGSITTP